MSTPTTLVTPAALTAEEASASREAAVAVAAERFGAVARV